MLQVDRSLSGSEVEVLVGESFEVTLPENPTTGYRWRLLPPSGASIEIQQDSFAHSGGAYGAGGVHSWRFRAIEAGTAELKMEYKRGWENRVAQTFNLAIHIKPQ